MPSGAATVDQTVATTADTCIFQSDRHAKAYGLESGITTPGDGAPCRAFRIKCTSASTSTLRVRYVPGYGTGQYAFVKAGETDEFIETTKDGIDAIYVSAASGTATFNHAIIA